MAASIPISDLVSVTPAVITAGGTVADLNGLLLTDNTRVPIGTVLSFASALAVATYFGNGTTEAALATNYFNGYDNAPDTPALLSFAQYNPAAVAGYVRGGSMAAVTLDTLKTYTGTMTVTTDGTAKTSSSISLSGATSFSNAATIIQAAFTSPNFAVSYDATASAFVITSNTTGASSTVVITTGTLATNLKLTAAAGAVTSPGAAAATPGGAMNTIVANFQNFATFATTFEPATAADKVAFASWANGRNDTVAYVMWDTTAAPATSSDTSSAGYLIQQADYAGTILVWGPGSANVAAFVMGWAGSLNFNRTGGRATLAWRAQSGLTPDVSDQTTAVNLKANGYNFYGVYANAGNEWNRFQDGSITGAFLWADSFVNQIWLNASLQNALVNLLSNVGAVPFNTAGYTQVEQSFSSVITQALDFGAIQPGVVLSTAQRNAVNGLAGRDIAQTLEQRGWYALVAPASAELRASRGPLAVTFFYTDGQAIQTIDLASIQVQ